MPCTENVYYGGRRYAGLMIESVQVFGGFRIANTEWVYDPQEGWSREYDFRQLPADVYPTEALCIAAIISLAGIS